MIARQRLQSRPEAGDRIIAETGKPVTDDRGDASQSSDPDAERQAAELLRKAAAQEGVEVAWTEWSRSVPNIDGRTLFLLKTAFEAGWDARDDAG